MLYSSERFFEDVEKLKGLRWTEVVAFSTVAVAVYQLSKFVRLLLSDADFQVIDSLKNIPQNRAFHGKVVWITGASSGIGEALAYELSRRGAKLVLIARREDILISVAQNCRDLGALEAEVFRLDLTDFKTHKEISAKVVSRFGRIDYLVNNAGRTQRGLIENTDIEVDRALMELDFLGTVNFTKASLPQLLSQENGAVVVNMSSMAGKLGVPVGASYSAAKHAMQGYFDSMRAELSSRGVRVVNVCPGPVRSGIAKRAFTERPSGEHGDDEESDGTKHMTLERCAALTAAAMWKELPEVWMAPQPLLLILYIAQYLPSLCAKLSPILGAKRVAAFRQGRSGYADVQSMLGFAKSPVGRG